MLDKPDGVIYAADLEQVREIAVWGDLTGYPSETGREGMSGEELWFMDEEGNLHTERGGIRSLEDLKWFPNLMYFQLVYNEVEDISILADMKKLVSADLSFNRISDISPLAEAKNLMTLHITDNQISDISALSNLKLLRTLSLQNNNVEDLEPLKDMEQLESLDRSYEEGFRFIEVDICLTSDGVPVLLHDWAMPTGLPGSDTLLNSRTGWSKKNVTF